MSKFVKSQIKKEDYYGNMYDIENLTDLNRAKKKRKADKEVSKIEKLIIANKSKQAEDLLKVLAKKNSADSRLKILFGALQIKNIVFGKCISNQHENLSPKNCTLEELSLCLKKSKKLIEKKMLVEKPVAMAWKKINPNPKSASEIDNFYIKTDAYVYELMAANHIVQTLYSYYVLMEKMKKLKIKTILDYGAGAATLSILFKNLGYAVDYADLPGKLFDFAKWRIRRRKMGVPMFNLKTDDIRKKYDCIICTEVFEHVVDPEALLGKLKTYLKKDGILVISESCEYTKDFASHLESNKKYGGKNFIKLMSRFGFKQILPNPFVPQMIFTRK